MLQVSWQQWSEVFERLGWASPLPEELWARMGGGDERQVDWQEVYRLIKSTGWSDQHAQTLWLTLNNFASATPETTAASNPEPAPEAIIQPEPVPEISPAPWDAPAAKPAPVQAAAPNKHKQARGISLPAIQLPSFLAQIDKRILIGLAGAVVLAVGYLVFFSGGSSSTTTGSQSNNTPQSASALSINQRETLRTYFSWKKDYPRNLCFMTNNCAALALDKRLKSIGTTSAGYKFMAAASMYKIAAANALRSPDKIVLKTAGPATTFQIPITTQGKATAFVCGQLVVDSGQVKLVADSDYKPANFMIGNTLKSCSGK